jgi:hypothetical protein
MPHRLHTLCFEYDESGGAGEDVSDATDEGADADAEAAAPAIDFSAPEFQDAVAEATQQQLGQLLQGLAAEGQDGAAAELPELDPYGDPQGFMGALQQTFGQIVDQRLGQIQPTVQAFEDQQNQTRIEEWCSAIPEVKEAQELLGEAAADLPENISSQATQFMATGYLRDLEERYGPGERAVNQALKMAASQLKQIVKAGHDAGYQARNNELRGISGAREPAPTAVESVRLDEQPSDELAAAEIWANRRGLQ